MEPISITVAVVLGVVVGAALAWVLLRGLQAGMVQAAVERERTAQATESARLRAELDNAQVNLTEARRQLEALQGEIAQQRSLLENEREAKQSAEGEVKRKLDLIDLRDRELESLQKRLSASEETARAESAARQQLDVQLSQIRTSLAEREKGIAAQQELLEQAQARLKDAFSALAEQQLEKSNKSFLELAKSQLGEYQQAAKGELEQRRQQVEALVKPIGDSLGKFNETVQHIEKQRAEAYGGISAELKSLREAQLALRSKADELTDALRGTPTKWGRWGELQLRNVVEMAGMLQYCDFTEQENVSGDEGAKLRPDMIVKLPNDKRIAVDSKAPIEMYLASMELDNEEARRAKLGEYALAVRRHMTDLTKKAYWDRIPGSPEFVVMFVPGESFFSAALEADPGLIEMGVEQRVILATPTTLIALLRAVAYGWKQEQLAENAALISEAGSEMIKRLRTFAEHLQRVGGNLNTAVSSYNDAVGSLERRILPQARRMQELGAGDGKALPEMGDLELAARKLDPAELFGNEQSAG
jgi:DNA recombination protein RmuC